MRQDVACYFCGSVDRSPYLDENSYQLVKCQRCGLLYVSPRPTDDAITEAAKLGVHGVHQQGETQATGRFDTRKVEELRDLLGQLFTREGLGTHAEWLDIGAGHGEALEAVRSTFGDDVSMLGLEPDMSKASRARRRGLDVTFFNVDNHGGRYDVISAFDVFSHLPNPRSTLLEWTELLRPDGLFILGIDGTADLPSFDHPRPLDLPDHVSFASERIVSSILADLGLDVEQVVRMPLIAWTKTRWIREAVKSIVPGATSRFSHREITAQPLRVVIKARRI